jgi:hypothetical protein
MKTNRKTEKIMRVIPAYIPEEDISAEDSLCMIDKSTTSATISTNTWTMAISGAPSRRNRMLRIRPEVPMETIDDVRLFAIMAMTEPTAIKTSSETKRGILTVIFL